jgi:hypothetical protein
VQLQSECLFICRQMLRQFKSNLVLFGAWDGCQRVHRLRLNQNANLLHCQAARAALSSESVQIVLKFV